jgi:hypothetical protein
MVALILLILNLRLSAVTGVRSSGALPPLVEDDADLKPNWVSSRIVPRTEAGGLVGPDVRPDTDR